MNSNLNQNFPSPPMNVLSHHFNNAISMSPALVVQYNMQHHQNFNERRRRMNELMMATKASREHHYQERLREPAAEIRSRAFWSHVAIKDYLEACEENKRLIQEEQKNSMDYEASLKPYSLFPGFRFARANVGVFQEAKKQLSADEYYEMRSDFAQNGREMDLSGSENQLKVYETGWLPPLKQSDVIWTMNDESEETSSKSRCSCSSGAPTKPSSVISNSSDVYSSSMKRSKLYQKFSDELTHCVFCKNNGANKEHYMNHILKDSSGRVLCPRLRRYKCPICGASGDHAHTMNYCPHKPIITLEDINGEGSRFPFAVKNM